MKKDKVVTILTIILILIIAFLVISKQEKETPKEIVQCIGEKSILYVQDGCSHCITQENLFGENLQYLNIIDCSNDWTKCQDILGTPTWKINNNLITGVQSIEKLQKLTRC